jgi:hypothetical protein
LTLTGIIKDFIEERSDCGVPTTDLLLCFELKYLSESESVAFAEQC